MSVLIVVHLVVSPALEAPKTLVTYRKNELPIAVSLNNCILYTACQRSHDATLPEISLVKDGIGIQWRENLSALGYDFTRLRMYCCWNWIPFRNGSRALYGQVHYKWIRLQAHDWVQTLYLITSQYTEVALEPH